MRTAQLEDPASILSGAQLSWIDQNGLLTSAQQIVNQVEIGRKGDE